jgi:3'(2'), 5'-bisphosphate nucleotidase
MRAAPAGTAKRVTHPFLDTARALACEAAARLMELRLTPLVKERKADHSLVTNADHAADLILRRGLRAAFPGHAILTEESGLDGPADAEYLWLVDPLDGTKAYAAGVTGFSVMVGLLKAGEPFAGVVIDPLEGHGYEAMKGMGAYHTFQDVKTQVHVSARREWETMPVITSTGFPERLEKPLRSLFPGPWIPAVNSVGVKVGYLVRQLADIYINHHRVHYWDTCAPQIILEEAGGVMTHLDGQPLRYALGQGTYRHRGATVATHRTRHEDVLSVLRGVMPPESSG